MARLIRVEQVGPYKIEPKDFPQNGKSIWICGCGLSSTMPICDGTHKTLREEPGTVYCYDRVTKAVVSREPDAAAPPAVPPKTPEAPPPAM
jgi:CDGSH-type Zn-finger protein